jgi:hypothetical protein
MATTYEAIATVTVGSGGAADITFSSIPATYTDLAVKISSRDTTPGSNWQNFQIAFNGVTTDLSSRVIYGNNTTATSSNFGSNIFMWTSSANATASTFGNAEIYIPNYASSNNKSVSADFVSELNGADAIFGLTAGLWANTSAITSIKLTPATGFAQYSTATLYGIKNS